MIGVPHCQSVGDPRAFDLFTLIDFRCLPSDPELQNCVMDKAALVKPASL